MGRSLLITRDKPRNVEIVSPHRYTRHILCEWERYVGSAARRTEAGSSNREGRIH
jgi:hypothetical protein